MSTKIGYTQFGIPVPNPPEGHALFGQKFPESPFPLIQGNTVPTFTPREQTITFSTNKDGDNVASDPTHNLSYADSDNWQKGWTCEGHGTGTVKLIVQGAAPISGAYVKIKYREYGTGTKKGTTVAVDLKYDRDGQSIVHTVGNKNMYTRMLDWGTWVSPSFSLGEGIQELTASIYVAHENWLTIGGITLVVPVFKPVPYKAFFYWKCVDSLSVAPHSSLDESRSYSVGTTMSRTSVESLAVELGLSASASYGALSAELTESVSQAREETETVSITREDTQTTTVIYNNEGSASTKVITLWQPCVEYQIGPPDRLVTLVDELPGAPIQIGSDLSGETH